MSGDQGKRDIEAPRKEVETAITFTDYLGIISNVRQKFYYSLAIRKDLTAGERNIVCYVALCGSVVSHYFPPWNRQK